MSAWAEPKQEQDLPEYVTPEEVAARWRLSKMTVYRMIESGELCAHKFSRQFRIPLSAVVEMEKANVYVPPVRKSPDELHIP